MTLKERLKVLAELDKWCKKVKEVQTCRLDWLRAIEELDQRKQEELDKSGD